MNIRYVTNNEQPVELERQDLCSPLDHRSLVVDVLFAGRKARLVMNAEGLVRVAVYDLGATVAAAEGNGGTERPVTFLSRLSGAGAVADASRREWNTT